MIEAPWITGWSGEDRYEARPCEWADGKLAVWQTEAQGEGLPMFRSRHMVRARRAIVQSLCGVCGEPTPPWDSWIFPIVHDLHNGFCALHEPAHHRACAKHAIGVCPMLAKQSLARKIGRLPVRRIHTMTAPGPIAAMEFGIEGLTLEMIVVTGMAYTLTPREARKAFPKGMLILDD